MMFSGIVQEKLGAAEDSITGLSAARRELSNQLCAAEEREGSLRIAAEDLQVVNRPFIGLLRISLSLHVAANPAIPW